jgi:hypothetical protein
MDEFCIEGMKLKQFLNLTNNFEFFYALGQNIVEIQIADFAII